MRLTDKYLIAYLAGSMGLGNRVRVLLASKSLAEHEGRRLLYTWPTGDNFGPKFSELWAVDDGETIPRVLSKALSVRYPYGDEKLEWLTDEARQRKVLQILTGGILDLPSGARSWTDELRALRPVPQISDQVSAFHAHHLAGTPYIGVQIRAHAVSHEITKQASPVEWFVGRMREIREQHPDVPFFLSCDVPEVQARIEGEFDRCHGLTDKGPYNSTQAVRSSIADLYLLASSGYLLGPHNSSFIHLAEYLSGDVLALETSVKTPADGGVDFISAGSPPDPTRPHLR